MKKNIKKILYCVYVLSVILYVFVPTLSNLKVQAATNPTNTIIAKAEAWCDNNGFGPNATPQTANEACIRGYAVEVASNTTPKPSGAETEQQLCFNGLLDSGPCAAGWNAAAKNSPTGPTGSSNSILSQEISLFCGNYINSPTVNDYSSCSTGVTGSSKGTSQSATCSNVSDTSVCNKAWSWEQYHLNPTKASSQAQTYCKPDSSNKDNYAACLIGYESGFGNDPDNSVCQGLSGNQQSICQSAWTAGSNALTGGAQANGTDPSAGTSCEDTGFKLAWITCDFISGTANFINESYQKIIDPLLTINTASLVDPSQPFYQVWSNFRIYGDVFLVIALLVVVFGESIGGGLIDAYSAKKILPRLLAAAILINISVYLVAVAVDISNILGQGIYALMIAPFQSLPHGLSLNISAGGDLLAALAAGTAVLYTHFLGGGFIHFLLMGILVPAALMFVLVIITIMIRQGLIYVLIFFAPIAFALYCLPNTEQYFRKWWDWLLRALLLFPIIGVVFAMANILSFTLSQVGSSDIQQVLALMALFAPLLLIPFSFRIAGGIIGQVHQAAHSNFVQPNLDKLKQGRAKRRQQTMEDIKAGKRYKNAQPGSLKAGLNRTMQSATMMDSLGVNPAHWRSRMQSARSTRISQLSSEVEKSAAARAVLSNDDLINAALAGRGTEADSRAYLKAHGQTGRQLEQNVASIRQAKADVGLEAFQDAAVAANAGTGTGYGNGPAEMFETINRIAGGDRARATRMLAAARGSAEKARRVDLSGAGFGESAGQLEALYQGRTNANAVNEVITDNVLESKSAGEIASSRNNAFRVMVGAMQRREARAAHQVTIARQSGNQVAIDHAEHEYKRIMAHTASVHDIAGQVSPENSQRIGALMGQNVSVGGFVPGATTYLETITGLRDDQEFQQYKREFGTAQAAGQGNQVLPGGGVGGQPG